VAQFALSKSLLFFLRQTQHLLPLLLLSWLNSFFVSCKRIIIADDISDSDFFSLEGSCSLQPPPCDDLVEQVLLLLWQCADVE